MHDTLIEYINKRSSSVLSDDEEALIKGAFHPKNLRRKQYFLQEGDVCKYYGFIIRGAMRQFNVDEKGAEHIVQLSIENWWVGDRESYTMLLPSSYNIDAWEPTDLLIIKIEDFLHIIDNVPAVAKMIRQLDQRHAISNQRRLTSAISHTAERRYQEFEKCHPEFLQRFPQHLIASYLGITKSSLSRIRGHSLKK